MKEIFLCTRSDLTSDLESLFIATTAKMKTKSNCMEIFQQNLECCTEFEIALMCVLGIFCMKIAKQQAPKASHSSHAPFRSVPLVC